MVDLTEEEWKDVWHLLYNVCTNNLVSPYVGDVRDNVRGPLQLLPHGEVDGETMLDPLSLEQLLKLAKILSKVSKVLFPDDV